jgi:hypothetical protein
MSCCFPFAIEPSVIVEDRNVKIVLFHDEYCYPFQICMDHILFVLRTPDERASGFVALGEMAGALGVELVPYLPAITSHLQDAVCFGTWQPYSTQVFT